MSAEIEDDDPPQLSAETLAALQEFYAEKTKREEIMSKLEEDEELREKITFEEDWQLSQFWYDEETVGSLVKVVQRTLPTNGSVALISCPTLFLPLRKALHTDCPVKLLEFDDRFKVHGVNFIHYDFNHPLQVPQDLIQTFDIVIADPPFLSEECLTKTSETVRLLTRDKIILCTGEVMAELAGKLLILKMCQFKPGHRNNLGNEFACFSNFELDEALR